MGSKETPAGKFIVLKQMETKDDMKIHVWGVIKAVLRNICDLESCNICKISFHLKLASKNQSDPI